MQTIDPEEIIYSITMLNVLRAIESRINYPAQLFGVLFPFHLEPHVYEHTADHLSADYRGGKKRDSTGGNGLHWTASDEMAENTRKPNCFEAVYRTTFCLRAKIWCRMGILYRAPGSRSLA
jgi:hypothetical protein